jgi:hypothetical protein
MCPNKPTFCDRPRLFLPHRVSIAYYLKHMVRKTRINKHRFPTHNLTERGSFVLKYVARLKAAAAAAAA